MAFNTRQQYFINDLKALTRKLQEASVTAPELKQRFDEEFATTQDNALDTMTTELAEIGLTYTAIQTAINQAITQLDNFWTGSAVATREYGQDARRVAE